jgi:thioredoxin 1
MPNPQYIETEIIAKNKSALVAFLASWCRPCGLQKQVITELASKYQNKFILFSVDVEKEEELAKKYKASTLPTIVFFEKGKASETMYGYQSEEYLEYYIKETLKQEEQGSEKS